MRRLAVPALLVLTLVGCGGEESPAEGAGDGGGAMTTPADMPTAAPDTATSSADGPSPPPASTPPPSSGGGSAGSTGSAPRPLPGLPAWTAGYRNWEKLNRAPLPPRDSDPHLGTKNVFVSMPAVDGTYAPGTIVVKEGFRPGKDFVGLVATMRKLDGENPEHHDWVFVEWARESPGAPFAELASGAVCESCHSGVADRDYVFTRAGS